jgi:hypothetical protein
MRYEGFRITIIIVFWGKEDGFTYRFLVFLECIIHLGIICWLLCSINPTFYHVTIDRQ